MIIQARPVVTLDVAHLNDSGLTISLLSTAPKVFDIV
jgi:hypothetical protein